MYELTYIANPNLTDPDLSKLNKKVKEIIIDLGGKISNDFTIQKRKLSYPIKKVGEGYFLSGDFQISAGNLADLENQVKAEENILRYLIITKKIAKIKPSKIKLTKAKAKPKEKIKIEELDKKLEELLKE